jgi:hypothetical protein
MSLSIMKACRIYECTQKRPEVLPSVTVLAFAGPRTRVSVLMLLVLPFAWILGKEMFQVVAVLIVLFHLARVALEPTDALPARHQIA